MATKYWRAYSQNWNAANVWASNDPTYFTGNRVGNVVTITTTGIDTSAITVGMQAGYAALAATAQTFTNVTAITGAKTFTVAASGTLASYLWSVATTSAGAAGISDDAYFTKANGNHTVTLPAGTTTSIRNVTMNRTSTVPSTVYIVGGSVSGAQLHVYGNLYWGQYYQFMSNGILQLRGDGSGTNTIYQNSATIPFYSAPNASISFHVTCAGYTLLSDMRVSTGTGNVMYFNGGRLNLNGFAFTGPQLNVGWLYTLVRPYVDFTNGGSFRCSVTQASAVTCFIDPYATLYTVGGAIEINANQLSVPVFAIGTTVAPASGTVLCDFKHLYSQSTTNYGTNFYCGTIDLSLVISASFTAGSNWYVKGLIWPNSATPSLTNINLTVFCGGGNLTYNSNQTPNLTINHTGTTTISTNWGSTTYFKALTLTSGTLSFAASTVATFGAITASGTTARGLTFGAGSYIQGGNTTAQTKTWADATNFTATGTFDMRTGGTGVQTIIFGTSGGATTSPNNAPEYTFGISGSVLSGYFKKINSNGYAPSTAVTTIRCNDFTGGNIFYYNTTLYAWGTSPAYIRGTTTLLEIGVDGVPKTIIFDAGTTQTVTNFTVNGTLGNLVTLESSSAGSQFNLSKSSGAVTAQYLSLKDSNATGGATWTANLSTFLSNVTGWLGYIPTYVKSRFMSFF